MNRNLILFLLCSTLAFWGVQWFFGKPQTATQVQQAPVAAPVQTPEQAPVVRGDESFYVLENEYQQLVFSTRGGSLAEINLPFTSNQNQKSIVRPIEIDRDLLEFAPQTVQFPSRPAYRIVNGASQLVNTSTQGGYYPLLRRGVSPEYYSTLVRGTANLSFRVSRYEAGLIQFVGSGDGYSITKTYTLPAEGNGPYCFDLKVDISGQIQSGALASGIPEAELVSGSYTPLLRVQISKGVESDVESLDLPKNGSETNTVVAPKWISNSNGFFGIILDPLSPLPVGYETTTIPGNLVPTRMAALDYPAKSYPAYQTLLPLDSGTSSFRIFAGPYDETLLRELDSLYDDPSVNYNPEYTDAQVIQGWFSFISRPFTKILYLLMQLFYAITHSWGISILLLTIALRVLTYPLNSWSLRSNMKMQELAPKVKAIQERYKSDPKRMQMEIMMLYKTAGTNPMSGCIPIFLQMPFLFGMFYLLKSSFPLRGAPFVSGWINSLTEPDVLFNWGFHIPLLGSDFHLLPFLTGLAIWWQQKLTAKPPADPNKPTDAEKQAQMMGHLMPILMVVIFYNFPSGLNLYFLFSTLLGILQQKWMTKSKPTNA